MARAQGEVFGAGQLSEVLRIIVELGDESFRLKKSLETASKLNARYALILGENEAQSGNFAVKNLATGEQVTVPRADLPARIKTERT